MPRMSKKRKQEWALFLNERNRITVFQEICRHEMLGDFSADKYLNLENLQKSS